MRILLAVIALLLTSSLAYAAVQSPHFPENILPPEITTPRTIILFGGDVMFDRSIRKAIDQRGGDFIFSCIDPILKKADLVVANLEGPITGNESVSLSSKPGDSHNFTFTFPPSTATLLFSHGFRIVNIGNNHIENFGSTGISSTIDALTQAHVGYFGDPLNHTVLSGAINHTRLAFIGYNEFERPSQPRADAITIVNINKARADGYLPIVYTHWGDEYMPANANQKNLAHAFVDAGAEIVIGSHPHVVEEHEIYKGKYIYYSLGNFVFDQYWEDSVRNGLLIQLTFTPSGLESIQEIPIQLMKDRRTCPLESTSV